MYQPRGHASKGMISRLEKIVSGESEQQDYFESICLHPDAMPRQILAIMHTGDRSEAVKTIKAPTLVLHGADDNLLSPPHGEHTAAMIEGSKLVIFQGMGHNMPEEVVTDLLKNMIEHMESVDRAAL